MKIIGISGKKQAGKNTVANYINGYILKSMNMVNDFYIDSNGKLIVQTKDNKYRVLIKDIYFIDDVSLLSLNSKKEMDNRSDFSDFITKNSRSEFRTSNTIIKGIGYMNSYFSELFTYSKTTKENW
jgi:dephospho-CoA kinase